MAATSAIHDGQRDIEDYTGWCHTGTREQYLKDLMEWAGKVPNPNSAERIVLITARTGTGKTALLRSFCNILENSGTPVADFASFFVWRNDTRRNTLKHFPATIAAQLCRAIPALIPLIERAVEQDPFLLKSTRAGRRGYVAKSGETRGHRKAIVRVIPLASGGDQAYLQDWGGKESQ